MPATQIPFADFALSAQQAASPSTPPVHEAAFAVVAHPLAVDGGECPGLRSHVDLCGVPVVAGCKVSVCGGRPVKVARLYGAGQFVFKRAGVEVTQFCCVVHVV